MHVCEEDHGVHSHLPGIRHVFALLLAGLLLVEASGSAQLPKTNRDPFAAPTEQALLVFTRPRQRQASETTFRIVDQTGRCIALLENDWQVAAPLWPGTHMLMILTGTAPPTVQLLRAKVTAGKTYVVRLTPRVNVKRPVQVQVLRRADQPLEAFPSKVKERGLFEPNLRKCTEWVYWKRAKIAQRGGEAKRDWDEANDDRRDAHTIVRGDGWTAAEVSAP